mmetsp:Transcript_34114/g.70979  ORF Transcript_34114/g.70979 Transcript_34114/m.70979 type:complete len:149 (-) Transcript_34114:612-1058(-)
MVSNFAYYRWNDVYPMLRAKIDSTQTFFMKQVAGADEAAMKLYKLEGDEAAAQYLTKFSVWASNRLHNQWMQFYGQLFARFRDFYTIVPKENEPVCGCDAQEPGMSEAMKRRIVGETGDHYKVESGGSDGHPDIVRGERDPGARVAQA